jgi:hypothetical protein
MVGFGSRIEQKTPQQLDVKWHPDFVAIPQCNVITLHEMEKRHKGPSNQVIRRGALVPAVS